MEKIIIHRLVLTLLGGLLLGCAGTGADQRAAGSPAPASATKAVAAKFVSIPPKKDNDLRIFYADGRLAKGPAAMDKMQQDAHLILWLAGNQFFAMQDVVQAFQKQHPGINVGIITLPPGLILKAIQAGGWHYNGKDYPGQPDVYASVNLAHLKALKRAGLMNRYAVYMHNELQIMVAKGNPKRIQGIDDLAQPGVRTSMPNPVNEGIMQFYIRKVLERHGLWERISGGKECVHCQVTPTSWFTAVHHRETPERILDGRSDAGVVWKTEVQHARAEGHDVEGVALPPADSLRNEVAYAIGVLDNSPHKTAAEKYMAFLATPAAQDTYAKYGFVKATPEELRQKPIL